MTLCRTCESSDVTSRGKYIQCNKCGDYTKKQISNTATYSKDKGFVEAMTERRIKTLSDLIEVCEIDTDIWEIEKWTQGKSEGYRKDRKVKWIVKNGQVQEGDVNDSGKLLIKPMYAVKAWLVRKTQEIRARSVISELVEDAKKFSPKYPKIKYKKYKDGLLYEIEMPDLQLGRVVMAEEAGKDSSPDLSAARANKAIDELIQDVQNFPISKILIPLGNDFFDSNTAANMTAHGTPQRDDMRWQRTYTLGRRMMVKMITKLSLIAPVDVYVIPGNHDEERIFYLGDALDLWSENNPNVHVNNEAKKRKYYDFGKCLIGLTHGYFEKPDSLAALMPYEEPEKWAKSVHREFHLGDKHHKKDMITTADEMPNGVVVRLLRSLATPSVWEFDKGLVGSRKAAEGFLWHPENGLIAQFSALGE